ncbi:MAG TPA: BatD family protein [Saprospiraceae bacterium]|nr:BatD family protein [Saprospiraceae bacterium]HNT21666.1 BatD family protein [Saprospiraceae bacterium]
MKYPIFFLLSLVAGQLTGQAGDVRVSVSRDTVLLGNAFFVQYTINRNDLRFRTPEFQDGHLLSQSSTSNTSIQDGKVQFQSTHRFLIQPERAGVFTIPSISLPGTTIPAVEIYVQDNPQGLLEDPETDMEWSKRDLFHDSPVKNPVRKTRKL